jgi:coenzyme F420-reducing hydrogenase gamma subunit
MAARLGIFGLSGCWGEQIVILNCEDELPALLQAVEIVDFPGGSSRNDEHGPLDIALVEGSVGSRRDEEAVKRIRDRSRLLVACGSCACFGGVAAAETVERRDAIVARIYGTTAGRHDIRSHEPVGNLVKVDLAIPGCPMEKAEFLQAMSALINGDRPVFPEYPVCMECRMRELDCLLISRGLPCAGPVTAAGCGARCPAHGVPCIGCRGPVPEANQASLREIFAEGDLPEQEIRRRLALFAPVGQGGPARKVAE